MERRHDLANIPLTCENTNTVMPYIDIVNEIFEYYVANDKLKEDAAYDTGTATTPELLAEPQNILPKAYDVLNKSIYPLTLPFDLWLETVRQFFNYFQVPLWQVLDTLRPDDDLDYSVQNPIDFITGRQSSLSTSAYPLPNTASLQILIRWTHGLGSMVMNLQRRMIRKPSKLASSLNLNR